MLRASARQKEKMQEQKICPYPGLRPFNEEESIFFRGREEHIDKIISQLEEKKFVMLTGASGDGKSSLVYAGVIPNAREIGRASCRERV